MSWIQLSYNVTRREYFKSSGKAPLIFSLAYPGRYTTLIVIIFFVVLSVLLVFVNSEHSYLFSCTSCSDIIVPLSAYTIQQEFTNNPNASIAEMPSYSSLLPSSFRRNPGNFVPHTFTTGDTFITNFSLFSSYKMGSAYVREDSPGSPVPLVSNAVSSFAYNNYDLALCDVLAITIGIDFLQGNQISSVASVSVCFSENSIVFVSYQII
jgi:hypothetical protein